MIRARQLCLMTPVLESVLSKVTNADEPGGVPSDVVRTGKDGRTAAWRVTCLSHKRSFAQRVCYK